MTKRRIEDLTKEELLEQLARHQAGERAIHRELFRRELVEKGRMNPESATPPKAAPPASM